MSVTVTIAVPVREFILGAALRANPGIHVRLQRVVPIDGAHTFAPYVWASTDDRQTIQDALRAEADSESVRVVDTVGDEGLMRVECGESVNGLLEAIAENDGVILRGEGNADAWRLQLRFDERAQLAAFHRDCTDRDISVTIERIHTPGVPSAQESDLGLTDTQRETLLLACEEGYFDVPRRINLVELAERQGVSDTAVSQRLRRGITALLEETLAAEDASEPDA